MNEWDVFSTFEKCNTKQLSDFKNYDCQHFLSAVFSIVIICHVLNFEKSELSGNLNKPNIKGSSLVEVTPPPACHCSDK